MSAAPAIAVSGLTKTYRVRQVHDEPATAAEALLRRVRRPGARARFDEFRALDDVSFEINWGEATGIVGRNGAGKSTLLKILTRITAPTKGRIELGGRVGSLLEVGTGFHPELTGRENIYLNGTLIGMRRKEIRARFDEIVDFSGVEKFLDTQVKRYSSGMYIRLAFAVAAHLETEILAVDEVLAVGDADFQNKCLRKMRQVAQSGRTVLLVSHQIQTVMSLCSSALYLEHGRVLEHGPVDLIVDAYKRSFEQVAVTRVEAARRPGSGELRFAEVAATKDAYLPDDEKVFEFVIPREANFAGSYYVSCHLNDQDGVLVLQCDSRLVGCWFDAAEEVHGAVAIRTPWLRPGIYNVDFFLCKTGIVDAWMAACSFQVLPIPPYPEATAADGSGKGVVFGDFVYSR